MKWLSRCGLMIALCSVGAATLAPNFPVYAAENATQKAGRAAIAANYKKVNAAALRGDLNSMLSVFAPDYQHHSRRTAGYQAFSRSQTTQIAAMALNKNPYPGVTNKIIKSQSKILSLTWRGPDAIVVVQNTGVNVMRQGNRSLRMEIVHVSRDYWSRVGNSWKMRQSVEREVKGWINGRRVNVYTNPF